ncbi:hypothetical protein [Mesobacillus selenatarsenatis]|nr:hypothetical protein [Mesobacillus selenatarsenatis]
MMKGSLEVKSVSKLSKTGGMKHIVSIANLPINKLQLVNGKYCYTINGQDSNHEVKIKLIFNKKIVDKRKSQGVDIGYIEFTSNFVTINLSRVISLKRIYKSGNSYQTSYSNINSQNSIIYEVSLTYKKGYFESIISPRVNRTLDSQTQKAANRGQRINNQTTSTSNKPEKKPVGKNQTRNIGTFTLPNRVKIGSSSNPYAGAIGRSPDDLRHRDICQADSASYKYSPNSDSLRPRNEFLGGTGSNMHR